jgi:quercetin dioxygenase-like cupin family protein
MAEQAFEFPEMIRRLPEADIPFHGVRGRLLQGEKHQAVFFEIEPIGAVSEHTHSAQFGVMLSGEMSLTFGGQTHRYRAGDRYFIPAGVPHSAVFHTPVRALDIFDEPARYRARK